VTGGSARKKPDGRFDVSCGKLQVVFPSLKGGEVNAKEGEKVNVRIQHDHPLRQGKRKISLTEEKGEGMRGD